MITSDEIASQPPLWRRAATLAATLADRLYGAGERACFVGCGTSLFVAQAAAVLREAAGHGEADAFPASEVPSGRRYDVVVAISRSGTTTEVVQALQAVDAGRAIALTAVVDSPVARAADTVVDLGFADERSVVQTRFATSALALLRAHVDPTAVTAAADDAERALALPLPVEPEAVEQWTFVARGWAVGLAHEAALKFREGALAWADSYPAFEYRHGPIALAAPGRVVWALTPLDRVLVDTIEATGATVVMPELDPMASLVLAQRVMVRLAQARGLDPNNPRNLSRSVVLDAEELHAL